MIHAGAGVSGSLPVVATTGTVFTIEFVPLILVPGDK
jgi:hypothetical protein